MRLLRCERNGFSVEAIPYCMAKTTLGHGAAESNPLDPAPHAPTASRAGS
jgi:hypothetical protein